MKEHPILFCGEMVRAILEGRKTQTRSIIKPQPIKLNDGRDLLPFSQLPSPFGRVGGKLWVRETIKINGTTSGPRITYKCDNWELHHPFAPDGPWWIADDNNWRPSIFMPIWASRITLEITEIRAQRIQDITDDDCIAEGMKWCRPKREYQRLWESLNAERGYSWASNPWVWVLGFRRV